MKVRRTTTPKQFGVRELPQCDPDELKEAVAKGLVPSLPEIVDEFTDQSCLIKDGDLVTLFGGYQQTQTVRIKTGERLTNRLGNFPHDDLIGQPMGTKVWDRKKKPAKWMACLPPSPEMHMHTLSHRTQILYTMDIAYSLIHLNLCRGSRVIESGTGSGAMTYFLSNTVGQEGRVFSFEYHPTRYEEAVKECRLLRQNDRTRLFRRNAYEDGFQVDSDDARECCTQMQGDNLIPIEFDPNRDIVSSDSPVDAVFLDLPEPWHALKHVKSVLKAGGRLIVFSPCIEQVHMTTDLLREWKWDVEMEVIEAVNFSWTAHVVGAGRMAQTKMATPSVPSTEYNEAPQVKRIKRDRVGTLSPSNDVLPDYVVSTARNCKAIERGGSAADTWPHMTPNPGHTGYLIRTVKPITDQ